jgi:hypothetical protein
MALFRDNRVQYRRFNGVIMSLQISRRLFVLSMLVITLACGRSSTVMERREPTVPVAPIVIASDLSAIDVCRSIPSEDIEAVMGRKLVKAPQRFAYYETAGTSGCSYDAGKDATGEAHFGYVVLTPLEEFDNQPLYKNVGVPGIGDSAYFNNGADARQLWVRINGKVAFVVAFGDVPNEPGAIAIAKLVAAAVR